MLIISPGPCSRERHHVIEPSADSLPILTPAGDNATTGSSIARQAGILAADSRPIVGLPEAMVARFSNSAGAVAPASSNGASAGGEPSRREGQVADTGPASVSGALAELPQPSGACWAPAAAATSIPALTSQSMAVVLAALLQCTESQRSALRGIWCVQNTGASSTFFQSNAENHLEFVLR